ncbi:hypothetical protein POM88_043412 [Heracleum sosnowskyi]|uniref:Lipase n=1 Tax=Heracleum sosnowskyi TaxID=360622 RepID=A0AAD8M4E5_9APIA|nr:hypothetical protein POM88_043412 [Heracleum sosnowskyi]
MELCEGGELLDRILAKKSSRYTEKDAARVVRQMLKVAAECHLHGLVHRDMKPEKSISLVEFPFQVTERGISIDDFTTTSGYDWSINLYPNGKKYKYKDYISLYIRLESEETDVNAEFELTLVDQSGRGKHRTQTHFGFLMRKRGSQWGFGRIGNLSPNNFIPHFLSSSLINKIIKLKESNSEDTKLPDLESAAKIIIEFESPSQLQGLDLTDGDHGKFDQYLYAVDQIQLSIRSVTGRNSDATSTTVYSSSVTSSYNYELQGNNQTGHGELSREQVYRLHNIVERLNSTGCLGDCINMYRISRKTAVDARYLRFYIGKWTYNDLQSLDCEEFTAKITVWILAAYKCYNTIFPEERQYYEKIFNGVGAATYDNCFLAIVKHAAIELNNFADASHIYLMGLVILLIALQLSLMDRQLNVDVVAVVVVFSLFFVSFPVLISACENSTSSAAASTSSTGSIVTGNKTDGLCSQVIQPLGYICSEHIVQTEDKYLLGLQRVSSSKANISEGRRGPPVLLLHGLFVGGEAWFLNGIDNSLGFLLADKGYDVWVGNVRGVQWSHGHVSLSKSNKEFWAWSWTELAKFDLPAMINYVNNITNSKVFVTGHSQGTLMSIVGFMNQELAKKVSGAAFLCPIAYLRWVKVPVIRMAVLLHVDAMVTDDIPSIDLRSAVGTVTMRDLCSRGDAEYCKDLVRSLTGKNCCFDIQKVNDYLRFGPQPTSTRNLAHLAQMVRSGYITVYDYGMLGNIGKYRRFNAPSFNLSAIPTSIPMWFASGENDALANPQDVRDTLSELQRSPRETATLEVPNYGHLDFLFSWSAKKDVYDNLFLFLGNHTSSIGA